MFGDAKEANTWRGEGHQEEKIMRGVFPLGGIFKDGFDFPKCSFSLAYSIHFELDDSVFCFGVLSLMSESKE